MLKKILSFSFIGLIALFMVSCNTPVTPASENELVINEMINLLKNRKYRRFLVTYYPTEKLNKIINAGNFEKAVQRFSRSSSQLLIALKMAQKEEPTVSPDNSQVTYNIPHFTLRLKKIKKRWYLYI